MTGRFIDAMPTATAEQLREAACYARANLLSGRPTAAVRELFSVLELAPRSIPARRIHVELKRAIELLAAERYSDARTLFDEIERNGVTKRLGSYSVECPTGDGAG